MVTLDEVAGKIIKSQKEDQKNSQSFPRDNRLFRYLYDAYCKSTGAGRCFDDLIAEEQMTGDWYYPYESACKELSAWYHSRYDKEDKEASGDGHGPGGENKKETRGASRAVTRNTVLGDKEYRFNEPLSSNSDRFKAYLVDGKPLSNGDAYDFILHTAVAFLLLPEQLEEVLASYGFHPLHVRNIHHMAIYCVLRDAKNWSEKDRQDRDPFQDVKDLYDKARALVGAGSAKGDFVLAEGEEDAFRSNSTRMIQNYIRQQSSLTKDNLLSFIENHPEIYDMRHHRLLSEHYRLASLFSELYIPRGRDERWDERCEVNYSLYRFANDYCTPLNHKRKPRRGNDEEAEEPMARDFKRQVFGYVANGSQHPTRELMIILWLYAYCFLYCPEVRVPAAFREKRPIRSTKDDFIEQMDRPFFKYVHKIKTEKKETVYEFSILEYLSDDTVPSSALKGFYNGKTVPKTFYDGSELIAFLNEKLTSYSWRGLDNKNAFDGMILCLSPITIADPDENGSIRVSYSGEQISFFRANIVANVPTPLVVIMDLLKRIRGHLNDKAPLICDYYELI